MIDMTDNRSTDFLIDFGENSQRCDGVRRLEAV
jgi:hypothetical protein